MITRANKNVTPVLRVLVVEDDENDALLLKTAFEDAGIKASVHLVCDGREAVDYLQLVSPFGRRTSCPLPNLLIVDLKLPRMDGWELLKWLRKQPGLKDVFVAVLSGSCCEEDFDRAYACGADLCLSKPLRYAKMSALVRHLIKDWSRHMASVPVANPPFARELPDRSHSGFSDRQAGEPSGR